MPPFSSTKAKRSTSGSTTIPKSARSSTTLFIKSPKCSFNGSGLCGNSPVGSQYNFTGSTPKASNKAGTAIPPVEFTPSTTTLNFAFLIASTSTNGRSKISSICKSI